MKLVEAADTFIRTQRVIDAVKADNTAAREVLKEHFRRTGRNVYRGIVYGASTVLRLDTRLARLALGPKKAAECTVESTRETLTVPPS